MYVCKRCGYDTNIKGNLKNHFRRKKTCKNTLSDIPVATLLEELNIKSTHNYTQPTHKLHTTTHNLHTTTHNLHTNTHNLHTNTHKFHTNKKNPEKMNFLCHFCEKKFSRSDSLRRHQKNYCNKSHTSNSETDILIENMKKELEKAKLEKAIMLNEMDKLMDKVGDTNIQNQQINIHINNFGTENMDYITGGFVQTLLEMPYKAVPKLLKNIHFNPAHPENHNVKITNKKLPFIGIWKDNKWEIRDKQSVLIDMLDKGFNILDDTYNENEGDIDSSKKLALEKFQEKYIERDKGFIKNLNKDLELLIINNSDMAKE